MDIVDLHHGEWDHFLSQVSGDDSAPDIVRVLKMAFYAGASSMVGLERGLVTRFDENLDGYLKGLMRQELMQ